MKNNNYIKSYDKCVLHVQIYRDLKFFQATQVTYYGYRTVKFQEAVWIVSSASTMSRATVKNVIHGGHECFVKQTTCS